ncbi:Rrf2 family transcriptional regulator [Lactobacillus sp. PV037]|uniref:Rrf2 family transcriptional regulator n=1 Tax=unclassified Lactobacillus TaxID=2620435 RepID=UPI0022402DC8|nr:MULTISPECIES: Rrf2 family transcriptional regulator [unclassified Lactobacillus]QNQ82212.1 Rrf2 family transcriptional regulator [Lactobacillus sp. PV012]QNQ83678.1 Rrf2 family transcriptional regulator [Lactobacillus sp. PV037]
MKYSYKLSDAIHLLSYLEIYKDGDLSSKAIARSIESNPTLVRQLMSDLRNAGIIATQKGKAGAKLLKSPKDINIYDIYCAINMDHNLLHVDPKTNPACVVGSNIQDTLNESYQEIEIAAFNKMKQISLSDIIANILAKQAQR